MSFYFGDPRLPERFWDKVEPEPNSGCWLWSAFVNQDGYGLFRPQSRVNMKHAHLHTYRTLVGSVSSGLELDHRCRVRCCVNPQHLEPVTHRENVLRGESPSAQQARRRLCDKCGGEFSLENDLRRCLACELKRRAEYYETNRAGILLKKKQYYMLNREAIHAQRARAKERQ